MEELWKLDGPLWETIMVPNFRKSSFKAVDDNCGQNHMALARLIGLKKFTTIILEKHQHNRYHEISMSCERLKE